MRSVPPTSGTADPCALGPKTARQHRRHETERVDLSLVAPIRSRGRGRGQSGSGSGRGSAKSPAFLRRRRDDRDELGGVVVRETGLGEDLGVERVRGALDELTTGGRQHEHRGPSVARVRLALDQAVAHEPVDCVGHARGVHLQSRDRAGHRHPSLAGEPEQAQHLVPGERQAERFEGRIDAREHELLGADDRRHGRHAGSGISPSRGRSTGASPRRSDRREAVLVSA